MHCRNRRHPLLGTLAISGLQRVSDCLGIRWAATRAEVCVAADGYSILSVPQSMKAPCVAKCDVSAFLK